MKRANILQGGEGNVANLISVCDLQNNDDSRGKYEGIMPVDGGAKGRTHFIPFSALTTSNLKNTYNSKVELKGS